MGHSELATFWKLVSVAPDKGHDRDERRIEHSVYGSDELRQDQDRFKKAGWEIDVGPRGGSS